MDKIPTVKRIDAICKQIDYKKMISVTILYSDKTKERYEDITDIQINKLDELFDKFIADEIYKKDIHKIFEEDL